LHGLRELGYVEGQNIVIEWRCAELNEEQTRQFAHDLIQLGVDVLVSANRVGTLAAKAATTTIPIVFVSGGDPVPEFVPSLAQPGGNVTGVTNLPGSDFFAKHLDLLMTAAPGITRVALLLRAGGPFHTDMITPVERATRAMGVSLHPVEVVVPDGFEAAFAAMTHQGIGRLLLSFDAPLLNHRAQLAELAAKHRLPAIAQSPPFARQGGLMSYAANGPALFRRAATYVDKILKGAKPGALPVEQPTKFNLIINLKTAKTLGLTIPPHLLVFADEVIQ
jgi:putative ABC transport system substrate-binding protein